MKHKLIMENWRGYMRESEEAANGGGVGDRKMRGHRREGGSERAPLRVADARPGAVGPPARPARRVRERRVEHLPVGQFAGGAGL